MSEIWYSHLSYLSYRLAIDPIEGVLQDWQRPELLLHYARYARASYALYLWTLNPVKTAINVNNICRRLICPCSKPSYVRGDVCCLCNFATFTARAPSGLGKVLSVSYKNEVELKPYAIVFDEPYKSVVITIQGSTTVSDAITDALALPIPMWEKLSELQKKKLGEDSIWKTFKGNATRLYKWLIILPLLFA